MDYPIEIIREKIDKEDLKNFLNRPFKELVKFVVDVEKEIIALGGELHSDAAEVLVEQGSDNRNLWGGNFYPLKPKKEDQIEYSSLMNIKVTQGNFSIDIKRKEIIEQINKVIKKLIS